MGLEAKFMNEGFLTSTVDALVAWARESSVWPMPMGISCCAIEMIATAGPKYDIARFGSEVMRFTPRQCDVLLVAGTVTYKMAHVVKKIYDQMPEPKWVIAMGVCASTGGVYRSYPVVQGIDTFLPVDVYVAGCPPRPENLLNGLMMIQEKIKKTKAREFQNIPMLEPVKINGN
ncbi:MAG: NADH-quinone oxidoreductase subunit B [Ignavibacteriales bacterium]|nr:MAG: NADH-quinone oxidoreductase subunit B [Ignavibacteriaceae bacterium]MBW7871931.1 NADH-quinone oxidoreductase subunit B [Ignavibacteria bacterium]MCZ2144218.1 NADH-quinone oxidoreductase subunit B [Ignavibacteriales bacterium]OQY79015.1 MAG: NADH-quinone oxidoreductase subunit B [Ignavibacteriales bacterium UTCHB3]MBV6446172.1 NADH-quinone oxidoreductase subunit B [Ignavibacteriaceae bacterium]